MTGAHVKGVCMRCGTVHQLVDLRREWTGLKVCSECFDHRHPQELLRVRGGDRAPSEKTAVGTLTFLGVNEVTPSSL